MDWIGMVQISLSIGTFGILVYEVFYNSRQRKIDRRISVTAEDQREKLRKLFDNVTGLLDIEKKFIYSKITEDELSSILLESLSYKVGVWININRKNKFADRLRDNCNSLATLLASSAETRIMGKNNDYLESAHRNVMDIWILVDKYIEEEENLIEYLLKSKEISGYLIKSSHFGCSFNLLKRSGKMKEIIELLRSQLLKMSGDGSWIFGAVSGGFAIAIPQWIYTQGWSINHSILIGILIGVIAMEWLIGGGLAKLSPVQKNSSEVAIDSAIRDVIIIGMCAAGYGFDFLFNTGSVIYVIITAAFIYHNFYSLVANIAVLGWEKHFPMWLLNWLDNEIAAKKDKYFPVRNKEEK